VEDEARLLMQAGHRVKVFAPQLGAPSGLRLLSTGLGTIWSPGAAEHVARLVKRWSPQLVHCHNLFPALSPSVIRAPNDGIPVVMTLHNYRLQCLPATLFRDGAVCHDCVGRTPWPGVLHRCYQSSLPASAALASSLVVHRGMGTFKRVRLFVAISEYVREQHLKAGFQASQIVVKRHFTWPSERRQGPGEYFLFLGRLSPEKGVNGLLEAWQHVTAKLLIVGDGPEAARLRASAPRSVEFRGAVAADEARELLRHARAVLVPSTCPESAGRVVLEAYAAGVPVVASRMGGLPEVVDEGVTGMLVGATQTEAWARAVEQLFDDTESERMGLAGWELWNKAYSPEIGLRSLENIYREALSREGHPSVGTEHDRGHPRFKGKRQ
jgi:glycosyltransferase involved in cell wall biosynthesis